MRAEAQTRYDFIKSPDCREVVVDGVHGDIGPKNRINMVVFTERNHIPASITHTAGSDGRAGPEVARDARDGVVRVIGTVLLLDLQAAKALQGFLAARIDELSAK
jgi:hypothetical protein